MRPNRITLPALATCVALFAALLMPAGASASQRQIAMIQDGLALRSDPAGTLQTFRKLGVEQIRVIVQWASIAPRPTSRHRPRFHASDPAAYPASNWASWDQIVRVAHLDGIAVDFTVSGGAPLWAEGRDTPHHIIGNPNRTWKPSAKEFGLFMRAIATRYSGSYADPAKPGRRLPAVRFWTIWNEPNFGEDLGPQAIHGSTVSVAPMMYRALVDAAWRALHQTGHGHDTILIGGLSARGQRSPATRRNPQGHPGDFAQTKPLEFVRTLYCVDRAFRPLPGPLARAEGCPSTAAGSRRFRSEHPGLFSAGGFAQHPYPQDLPPNRDNAHDRDFLSFPELPNLWRTLDRVQRVYASHTHFLIYNDEYGYITHPPNHARYVSPTTAADYINWAEYLSWRWPRVASYAQYLLRDPLPPAANPKGGFTSGLERTNGRNKPAFDAFRLPLFLPKSSGPRGSSLEVWGCARPAHFIQSDTGSAQTIAIQFQRGSHGAFSTLRTLQVNDPRGYFDLRLRFPASGTVRLAYTYPDSDPFLPANALGVSVHSRSQQITLR